MDKALGVTGQPIMLLVMAAMKIVIIEELMVQENAVKIVESHLSYCKCTSQKFKCYLENYNSDSNDFPQVPCSTSMVETKWQHSRIV